MDTSLRDAKKNHNQEELDAYFAYYPGCGELRWKVDKGRARAGDVAGTRHNKGYLAVEVDGVSYLVHRVIWCLVHGEWPQVFIDHENLDGTDNRLTNLRLASRCQNNANQARRNDNTSGVKGVSWHSRIQKWLARVQAGSKRLHLGYFDTLKAAEEAVVAARLTQHKEFSNNG